MSLRARRRRARDRPARRPRARPSAAAAAIVAALLAFAAAPAHAPAATITGFADQGIGRPPGVKDGWGATAQAVADALAPQVTQARYNVAWDVARLPPGDPRVADVDAWLAAVARRGLEPLVSFSADGPADPATADYAAAVRAFRARHPQIVAYTAWNEPNDRRTYASPQQAAAYLKALSDACAGACTVAAGDFAGTRRPGDYFAAYAAAVAALGLAPAVWAYHPYEVVNDATSDRFDGLAAFWAAAGASSPRVAVWFTEVGVFQCVHGVPYGPLAQNAAAQRLNALLGDPVFGKASRVYYYHLANGPDCDWDTGLVGDDRPRPALRTLLPLAFLARPYASIEDMSG